MTTLLTAPLIGHQTPQEPRTTAGAIAIANLEAQIAGLAPAAALGWAPVPTQVWRIELIALRGHLLGRIADCEAAAALADQLAEAAPWDGEALLARARSRSLFHRFGEALADLEVAAQRGADPTTVTAEHAGVLHATGAHEAALAIYREAVERRADFHSLGDLAVLHAENGDVAAAERAFDVSRARYRGVSPIPLAQFDLKRAQMWIAQGDLPRARSWLDAAVRRLPAYAPAAGHLADVEAALGETESAATRRHTLAASSDDPHHAARLARALAEEGRAQESEQWRGRAAARYEELLARHPAAFADHAAEFWLDVGADPHRALALAEQNFAVRPTRQARDLVARAAGARPHLGSLSHLVTESGRHR